MTLFPWARRLLRPRTLSVRVGVEIVVLTVLVNVLLGTLATWVWMRRLRTQLDEGLMSAARQVAVRVEQAPLRPQQPSNWLSGLTLDQGAQQTAVIVRDPEGLALEWIPPGIVQHPSVVKLEGRGPKFETVSGDAFARALAGDRARVLTVRLLGDRVVQVARSLTALDGAERLMRMIFLVAFPPLTAAASLAAWMIASRRLDRLRQIAGLAREINPERLDRRLDPGKRGAERDELGELSLEVNRMLDRLQAGFDAQDRFIGDVSHELKTPVSVLLIESQIMMRTNPDHVAYARFVASVEEEMHRLGKLIESFLTLARAAHSEARPLRATVDINDTAMEASQHCWSLAKLRDVRLSASLVNDDECPVTPLVAGDPELLRTMVENLLRNAITVSPRGAGVDLSIACEDKQVVVLVRDRGPGVPDELAARIFQRFVTADPTRQGRIGSGLGLTIARKIAAIHGGEIEFENLPAGEGGGARFIARIPLLSQPPAGKRG